MADDKDVRRRNIGNGDVGNGGEWYLRSVNTVYLLLCACRYFDVSLSGFRK